MSASDAAIAHLNAEIACLLSRRYIDYHVVALFDEYVTELRAHRRALWGQR